MTPLTATQATCSPLLPNVAQVAFGRPRALQYQAKQATFNLEESSMEVMGLALAISGLLLTAAAAARATGAARLAQRFFTVAWLVPLKAIAFSVITAGGGVSMFDAAAGGLTTLLLVLLAVVLVPLVLLGLLLFAGLRLLRLFMSQGAYDTMLGTLAADAVRAGARRLFGIRR